MKQSRRCRYRLKAELGCRDVTGQVRFVASELGSDAGLFGAGRLAMLAGEA